MNGEVVSLPDRALKLGRKFMDRNVLETSNKHDKESVIPRDWKGFLNVDENNSFLTSTLSGSYKSANYR